LAATRDIAGSLQQLLPASLTLLILDGRAHFLVHQKLAATDTDTTEDIENHGEKLNIVHGPCHSVVAKMARAVVIRLAARTALLSIF
jgi:hypothetical protein